MTARDAPASSPACTRVASTTAPAIISAAPPNVDSIATSSSLTGQCSGQMGGRRSECVVAWKVCNSCKSSNSNSSAALVGSAPQWELIKSESLDSRDARSAFASESPDSREMRMALSCAHSITFHGTRADSALIGYTDLARAVRFRSWWGLVPFH